MMAQTTSITMQNLVEIARRTSEREDEMWCFSLFLLPARSAAGSSAGISFTHGPNLVQLCKLRTRINYVNFIKIEQGTRPLGALILVKFEFFSVLGALNPHPWTDQGQIWQEGADLRSAPPCQIWPWSVQRVAPAGRKTPKSARE